MKLFWEGVVAGVFAGGLGGYVIARSAFNRATTRVAQYILAGRPQRPKPLW